jgi:hypothetical protein
MWLCRQNQRKGAKMVDEKKLAIFLGEFDYQVRAINRIHEILETRTPSNLKNPIPEALVESIGYWLHN